MRLIVMMMVKAVRSIPARWAVRCRRGCRANQVSRRTQHLYKVLYLFNFFGIFTNFSQNFFFLIFQ
jgi:hypothetical protein